MLIKIEKKEPYEWLWKTEFAQRLPDILTARIQYMLEQNIRFTTSQQYKSGNNHYLKFCQKYGIYMYPITELKLLYYISDALTMIQSNSVKSYITAIKHHAKINGFAVDTSQMQIYNKCYESLNHVFGANDTKCRKPFTFEMIIKAYKLYNMRKYNELVYYTSLVCGMIALMRPSEFAAAHSKVSVHKQEQTSYKALFMRNVKMHRKKDGTVDYYTVTCMNVKTDKTYKNVTMVWSTGEWPLSPAQLITRVLQWRLRLSKKNPKLKMTPTSPLFMLEEGTIMTYKKLKDRYSEMIIKMKLDPLHYPLYSLKDGATTSYARRGVETKTVQMLGRWKSDAYQLYIKYSNEDIARMQTQLAKQKVINKRLMYINGELEPQHVTKSKQ